MEPRLVEGKRQRGWSILRLASGVVAAAVLWMVSISHAQPGQGFLSAPGQGAALGPVNTATVPQVTTPEPVPRPVPRGHDIDLEQWKQVLHPNSPYVPVDPTLRKDPAAGQEPAPAAPTSLTSFAGIAATGWFPPDPHIAAGPSDLVAVVNSSWAAFTKGGTNWFQTTFSTWFSNVLPTGVSVFDPRVIWDPHLRRFIIMATGLKTSTSQAWWLLSFSPIGTPSGTWCNIATDATLNGSTPTTNWNDYPRIGVDTRGIYLTANMFGFSAGFQYVKLRVLNKAEINAILFGGCSGGYNWWDFWDLRNPSDNSLAFTVNPVLSYGEPAVEYLVNSRSGSGSTITLWRLAGAHLIPGSAPILWRNEVPVFSYSLPPDAVQPGGVQTIDTGDARLYTAVLTAAGIWTSHSISCQFGVGPTESCIRAYLIDPAFSRQQWVNTYGGGEDWYYYYPDITADPFGNATVVFSRSNAATFAEARFTGRRVGFGNLESSALLQAGTATYLQIDSFGRNRWGDYLGAAVDPDDPNTIWFIGEYVAAMNTWGTRIGAAAYAP